MDEIYNKHYIDVDDRGRIIGGFSDGPHSGKSADGYILLRSDGGYQFRLYPDGEENPALWDMDGIPLYKYEGGEVVPRTEEELAADRGVLPKPEDKPSPEERIAELEAALEDAKKQTVACLFDLKVIPKTMTDGYESWWNVGLADVSEKESVRKAWEGVKAGRDEARKY